MQVVILAGGLGTRLSEETNLIPKPMVQIGGKPILWHIMKIYSAQGFNDFVICLGYKGSVIKDFFTNYYIHNSNITVDLENNSTEIHNTNSEKRRITMVDTGAETMTGGRIKKIIPYLKDDIFFLTYGDGVSNVDINSLLSYHKSHGKLATLTAIQPEGKFGKLGLDGDKVFEFAEKKDNLDSYINGGFMVLNKKVSDYIYSDNMPFEKEPLEKIAKDGELMAFKHHGFWYAMDTLQNKNHLEKLWLEGNAPWQVW